MSIRLILVRHGLTPWNHEFRYQGHTDIELSPEGIEQAKALQKRFSDEKLEAVYSSDLSRALQTARIIAEPHRLEVQVEPGLREINFGVWEGLTYAQLEKDYPELLKTWLEKPHELKIPGAETFSDLRDRAVNSVKKILAGKRSGNVMVVTHGGTIAALVCGLLNKHLSLMWNYKQKNSSVTILTVHDDKTEIEVINDLSHWPLK